MGEGSAGLRFSYQSPGPDIHYSCLRDETAGLTLSAKQHGDLSALRAPLSLWTLSFHLSLKHAVWISENWVPGGLDALLPFLRVDFRVITVIKYFINTSGYRANLLTMCLFCKCAMPISKWKKKKCVCASVYTLNPSSQLLTALINCQCRATSCNTYWSYQLFM